jgi:hypothetical protein
MKQEDKGDFMNGNSGKDSGKDIDYERRNFLKKMGLLGGGIIIYFTTASQAGR